MLIESEEVTDPASVFFAGEDVIFRFCSIQRFHTEGGSVEGAFLSCTLSDLDIYWGLFNGCIFVGCRFKNCTFRGTSFPSCSFVECEFVDCNFTKDNLGSECAFEDVRWYGCKQKSCIGIPFEVAASSGSICG